MRMRRPQKIVIGHCIYCDEKDTPLSKEHVVAKSLGGIPDTRGAIMTIHEASCRKCAEITRDVERECVESMFDVLRMHAGVDPTHGQAPAYLDVQTVTDPALQNASKHEFMK